jgi:hypothetical protein
MIMKRIPLLLLIISSFFAKAQVTPQWKAPDIIVNSKDSLGYFYPGKIGRYSWLYNAEYIRANFAPITGGLYSPLAGSSSLTNVGTITTGIWHGSAIGDTYISSALTWNAKQSAITFGIGVQTALAINIGSIGSPILFNGAGGTPSSLVGTNITGTAAALNIGGNSSTVTTNANLTGAITSVGNATSLGSFSSASLLAALTTKTGTGNAVFSTAPTFTSRILAASMDASAGIRATGFTSAASGSGLELLYYGGGGQIYSYDRTGSVYLPTTIGVPNQMYLPINGNVQIGSNTGTSGGEKFQVTGTASISSTLLLGSTLTLSTAPTTSAGTYDLLTRNTSTGAVEKIAPITGIPTGSDGNIVGYYDGGIPISIGRLNVANAYDYFTPATGATVTLVNNHENIINPSGALAALTLALPSSPADGDVVNLTITQAVTTISYSGGTVVGGLTSATTGAQYHLTYRTASTTWY